MPRERRALAGLIALCALTSCASPAQREPVPTGRLPADTRPLHYRLEIEIDPSRPRFAGRVEIEVELDRARSVIWLHALDLSVSTATVELAGGQRIAARFEPADPTGVAALRLAEGAGWARSGAQAEAA